MKIVVTGGAGFIGSSFTNLCLDKGDEVTVIDKITYAGSLNNLNLDNPNIKLILEDINKVTKEDIGEYDYLVNFAAESHVDNSIQNGKPFVRTNVEGTYNLLEIARQNSKLKKFIQISTDEVYGDMLDYGKEIEATPEYNLFGSSYYSATKASADLLVQAASRTYGIPYLITRTCNNYGENQHKEKLIPTIIDKVLDNKSIPIYGDGKNIREWIYVEDNCKIIYDLMLSEHQGIKHIGTGERYTNLEIIGLIEEILGKTVDFDFVEDRKGHDRIYALDSKLTPNIVITSTLKSFLTKILLKNERND